jgi:hypothetical protein
MWHSDTNNIGLRAYRFTASLIVFLSVFSCAALNYEEPTTPEAAVRAFAIALDLKDYKTAYNLMSLEYRNRVSFEEFQRQLTENLQELSKMSDELAHITSAQELAIVSYSESGQVRLTRDGTHWRIASDMVNYYDQSTPRAALKSFVRALENGRYDVVMRLIPSNDKEGLTSDKLEEAWSGKDRDKIERLLNNLRGKLDNPIEQTGKRATMPYGEHLSVEFVFEGKNWKIENPE